MKSVLTSRIPAIYFRDCLSKAFPWRADTAAKSAAIVHRRSQGASRQCNSPESLLITLRRTQSTWDELHFCLLQVLTALSQIYAKAFDQDERLLAVGFLDVGVHTTCIRTLKNLILVGDAIKGLGFIAFQVRIDSLQKKATF